MRTFFVTLTDEDGVVLERVEVRASKDSGELERAVDEDDEIEWAYHLHKGPSGDLGEVLARAMDRELDND